MQHDNNASGNYRDQPTYWFAILDIARERDDYDRAAEANRELKRLGVDVSFRPRKSQGASR